MKSKFAKRKKEKGKKQKFPQTEDETLFQLDKFIIGESLVRRNQL